MKRPPGFLAGLSPDQFLDLHWQKRPLLVRDALPTLVPPVSAEELAGLALEAEVESRLVLQQDSTWQLLRGPFEDDRFATLPETHWTLLVQDLDQHLPAVSDWFELLDFLPSYRLDDIMASFAPAGGSVGPHYDQYDVFLLQVTGHRRWQLSTRFDRQQVRADTELCILSHFEPEQEWVLGPGDMLYLPPHVAHFGVALDDCITFSLGCRAPSVAEIVSHFARRAIETVDDSVRYTDADLQRSSSPHVLDPAALARVEALLHRHLRLDAEALARGFATLVTEPKALFAREYVEPLAEAEVLGRLRQSSEVSRRKGSRWLLVPVAGGAFLAVDGMEFRLESAATDVAEALCRNQCFDVSTVSQWLARAEAREVVSQLLRYELLEPLEH